MEQNSMTAYAQLVREPDAAKQRADHAQKLYDLTLNNELRWMRKHSEIEAEFAVMKLERDEFRAEKERLVHLLADCLDLLKIALNSMAGAFANAVWADEIPRFQRAIDAARAVQGAVVKESLPTQIVAALEPGGAD